jgi:hypothetical protein
MLIRRSGETVSGFVQSFGVALSASVFLLAASEFVSGDDKVLPPKPIFSCNSGGQKIEVFAKIERFEPEKHKFELIKKVGKYGFEEWSLDGRPLIGTNDFLRGDGFGDGWKPSDFKTVLSSVEPGLCDRSCTVRGRRCVDGGWTGMGCHHEGEPAH